MRKPVFAAVAALVVLGLAYYFVVRDKTVSGEVRVPVATATIGSGSEAVAVGPDGAILAWYPLGEDAQLPQLPLGSVPENGRLAGPVLAQARVLGAAPAALRPHVERSYYGESGVDVILRAGIELRFGDPRNAAEKWKAAAAVLANPAISTVDYVDLHSPAHPSVAGSGHTLPALP